MYAEGLPLAHLWETALVIQDSKYAVGFSGDEVNAGLVVIKWNILPWNLLPVVLLLHGNHINAFVLHFWMTTCLSPSCLPYASDLPALP